jgi:hypothetical protein
MTKHYCDACSAQTNDPRYIAITGCSKTYILCEKCLSDLRAILTTQAWTPRS